VALLEAIQFNVTRSTTAVAPSRSVPAPAVAPSLAQLHGQTSPCSRCRNRAGYRQTDIHRGGYGERRASDLRPVHAIREQYPVNVLPLRTSLTSRARSAGGIVRTGHATSARTVLPRHTVAGVTAIKALAAPGSMLSRIITPAFDHGLIFSTEAEVTWAMMVQSPLLVT